jgi:hypothetical protein
LVLPSPNFGLWRRPVIHGRYGAATSAGLLPITLTDGFRRIAAFASTGNFDPKPPVPARQRTVRKGSFAEHVSTSRSMDRRKFAHFC